MAGIYLHIPFCKQACHYCDFHFSTSLGKRDELLKALHIELFLQKIYLGSQSIETIYFGGGTPSLLTAEVLQSLIDKIATYFQLSSDVEITLEANPDDLNAKKVREIKQTAINRLSIGIQSFFDADLRWMNRAHTAGEAEGSIKRVQDVGLENITIDLIYGYPLLSHEKWANTLSKAIQLQVPHISAYAMTVEPRTALASFIYRGKQQALDEAQSAAQFIQLMDGLEQADFEHYEISNFAKSGQYSKHNTNYWSGVSYLGIGPSAHSFNGQTRQWNVANNAQYLQAIDRKQIPAEIEILTQENQVNEYIMTSLRTSLGMDLMKIKQHFGERYLTTIKQELNRFLEKNWINIQEHVVTLSREGKLFADHVASELFVEDLKT